MKRFFAQQWYNFVIEAIQATYSDQEERKSIAHILLSHQLPNYSKATYICNPLIEVTDRVYKQLKTSLQRLKSAEPIQYILGQVNFLELTLCVTPAVLIPRPETEELAAKIRQRYPFPSGTPSTILDIGTGSGCLAIALAKRFPKSKVTALDLSAEALSIAEKNAYENGCKNIKFLQKDLLAINRVSKGSFDLIVSNPPYIPIRERKNLAPHIKDYEPHSALFVPDQDPCLFYRKISAIASLQLSNKGLVAVELYSKNANQVATIWAEAGLKERVIEEDLQGKKRFLWARKKVS